LENIGNVILAKPILEDLKQLRRGGIIWGWPHCVQQTPITQVAIDRKLTLIAFEDMFSWKSNGKIRGHTFYKNSELAGYCAVLHALQLKGIDGIYGNQRKILIFGFGAVSRGAIYALKARGFIDITICLNSPVHKAFDAIEGCKYIHILKHNDTEMHVMGEDGTKQPLINLISKSDIIVNAILQDPDKPVTFVKESDASQLKAHCLIIDVRCDEGMGFYFSQPTTFTKPILKINGLDVDYYAVDHTPSYLWEGASRSVSEALIEYLPTVVAGPESWQNNVTIRKALNIENGEICNPLILSFQNRQTQYPYKVID
jgi:N5-(carboxyethyl)ornithine synthase